VAKYAPFCGRGRGLTAGNRCSMITLPTCSTVPLPSHGTEWPFWAGFHVGGGSRQGRTHVPGTDSAIYCRYEARRRLRGAS
jgi:hypothetical protein